MIDEKFQEYLKEHYADQINYYNSKSGWNKRMYNWFQWGVIISSAVLPVLVVSSREQYKWAAAGLSVLLAIGTAALKVFKFQENWLPPTGGDAQAGKVFLRSTAWELRRRGGQANDVCRPR